MRGSLLTRDTLDDDFYGTRSKNSYSTIEFFIHSFSFIFYCAEKLVGYVSTLIKNFNRIKFFKEFLKKKND